MKKIIVLLTAAMLLTGCNRQIVDTTYLYDKAIINMGGDYIEIQIKSWKDYEGEQIQLTDIEGNVYLTSSFNCVLVKEK